MGVVSSSSTLNKTTSYNTEVILFLLEGFLIKQLTLFVNNWLTWGQMKALRTGQDTRPLEDLS